MKWSLQWTLGSLTLDDVMYLLSNKFHSALHQLSTEGVPILDKTWDLWDLVC